MIDEQLRHLIRKAGPGEVLRHLTEGMRDYELAEFLRTNLEKAGYGHFYILLMLSRREGLTQALSVVASTFEGPRQVQASSHPPIWEHTVTWSVEEIRSRCGGSGYDPVLSCYNPPDPAPCEDCRGSGRPGPLGD